jgi:hypothetical protein
MKSEKFQTFWSVNFKRSFILRDSFVVKRNHKGALMFEMKSEEKKNEERKVKSEKFKRFLLVNF